MLIPLPSRKHKLVYIFDNVGDVATEVGSDAGIGCGVGGLGQSVTEGVLTKNSSSLSNPRIFKRHLIFLSWTSIHSSWYFVNFSCWRFLSRTFFDAWAFFFRCSAFFSEPERRSTSHRICPVGAWFNFHAVCAVC